MRQIHWLSTSLILVIILHLCLVTSAAAQGETLQTPIADGAAQEEDPQPTKGEGTVQEETPPTSSQDAQPFKPNELKISAIRGEQALRTLLFELPSGVNQVQILPQDLNNGDNSRVLPATAITAGESATSTLSGRLPLTLTFNLKNVPAGKYTGEMLVSYTSDANDEQWLPITLEVRDWWVWPILVLALGVVLGVGLTFYRQRLQPRDELVLRREQLTTLINNDPDLREKDGLGASFRDRINSHLVDLQRAMDTNNWEKAKEALSAAEKVFDDWRKNLTNWQKQLRAEKELLDTLQRDYSQWQQYTYLREVTQALEDAVSNAPDKTPQDLRATVEQQTIWFNEYKEVDKLIDMLQDQIGKLKDDDKSQFETKPTEFREELQDLSLANMPAALDGLKTNINDTIREVKAKIQSVLRPAEEAHSMSVFGSSGRQESASELKLVNPPPSLVNEMRNNAKYARQRQLIFQYASMFVSLVLLVGVGFNELYVNQATFGANVWGDYFALFAWGFGAEATRSAITDLVRGWDLGIVPSNVATQ